MHQPDRARQRGNEPGDDRALGGERLRHRKRQERRARAAQHQGCERFALRYRGTTGSDGVTATFDGSLRYVVGRVLDGYNYFIETRGDGLEVVVLGAASSHAVPAPVYAPPTYPAKNVRRTD